LERGDQVASYRWVILGIVYLSILAFTLIFQSIPPLLPLILSELHLTYAQSGLLRVSNGFIQYRSPPRIGHLLYTLWKNGRALGVAHPYFINRHLFAHYIDSLFNPLQIAPFTRKRRGQTAQYSEITARDGMANLVCGLFLALVQCCLYFVCHICASSFSPEGLYTRTKRPPYCDSPFGFSTLQWSHRIFGRPIQASGMAHRDRRNCIGNSGILFQLQLFLLPSRRLDGNLLGHDSRSDLFASTRGIKTRKCGIRIWSHLHLLEHWLVWCTLPGRKSQRLDRL
jgi:hypothetical protein